MTKKEALAAMNLLSALESWVMSQESVLPDYLAEYIVQSMNVLERIILEEKQS